MFIRYKELAANVGTFLVSFLFCVAVAEIGVRVAFPDDTEPGHADGSFQLSDYVTHDPVLGWKLKPNSRGTLATSEYTTRIDINSNGVRGPELSYAKAEKERRILILGDSFAEGYAVDLDNRFSDLLGKQLNSSIDMRMSVVNLGVGGYSTDQELLQFRNEGKKYEPDMVVLLVHDNDVMYNIRDRYWRGGKPVFTISGGALRLTNTPVPYPRPEADSFSDPQESQAPRGGLAAMKAWLDGQSRLYRFARHAVRNDRVLLSHAVKIGLADERSLPSLPSEFNVYARSYDPETAYAWTVTERIIRELDFDVAKAGAELRIAYSPSRAAVYPEDWTATKRKYGLSGDEWSIDRVREELHDVCGRLGVPFLDLTPGLRAAAADLGRAGKTVYFAHDGHWTAEGNAHVAAALARFLNQGRDP